MPSHGSKKIVVIKDLPSNIFEEAIFILKGDPGVFAKPNATTAKGNTCHQKRGDDFLIKEAHTIINSYIGGSLLKNDPVLHLKPVSTKGKSWVVNSLINLALAFSIALLIYILSKAI